MNKRLACALLLVPAVVGCSGSSAETSSSKSPSASSSHSGVTCTKAKASSASQDNITHGHFVYTCVLVKRGTTFFFTNSDDNEHVLKTTATSPQRIDATLAKRGGTLAYKFSRVGQYVIKDSASADVVVIIVE